MATVAGNAFELERRAFMWSKDNTLDDGVTSLLWDADPNTVSNGNTDGESKLYSLLPGATYFESSGTWWLKIASPNTWIEIVTPSIPASSTTIIKECESSANVGDTVYMSGVDSEKVVVNSDNKNDFYTIGMIKSKISSTFANVLLSGKESVSLSLAVNSKIFLASDGGLTTAIPSDGYVHVLGFHFDGEMIFKPDLMRVKLSPF